MASSDWFVLVNPAAGRGTDLEARTRSALRTSSVSGTVQVSSGPGDIGKLIDGAVADGRAHFVAVGGDGTVNLVVDALLRHPWNEPPTLGVLPAGTGCDFVRIFGIPQQLERAVRHLKGEQTYLSDAGIVSGGWGERHFLNVAQTGIGAASAIRADRLSRLGKARYQAAFWLTLPTFHSAEVRLRTEKRTFEGRAMGVIFANGQFFGGGMNIAPKATLVSGRADVQVITADKRQAPLLMRRAARGLHLRHPAITRMAAAEWELDADGPWPVEVDGEVLGTTPIRGRILPGAVRIKI